MLKENSAPYMGFLLLPYAAAFAMGKSPQHHILVCQSDQISLGGGGDTGRVPRKSTSPFQKSLIL